MLYLLSDNGAEFKNPWFASFVDHLGILEAFAPPKSPNARARGERFFRTFESWLHEQPGSTSSSPTERGEHIPEKHPFLTIEKSTDYWDRWLETVYHNTPHRNLKKPPLVAWDQAMKNRLPPEKFTDAALESLCRKVAHSKITNGRVHFLCLSWTGPNLPEISARLNGKKAICYYDPTDLGEVWVAHPDDPRQAVRAFATAPEYQNGLTLTEHKKIKEAEKEDALKYGFDTPHLALRKLRQDVDEDHQLSQPTKKIKRKSKAQSTPRTKSNTQNQNGKNLSPHKIHYQLSEGSLIK